MVENEQIKLLALNGVAPTKETIRSGEYPISSNFYAVTASPIGQPAPEETNAELRAFLDWILSDQGQEIIEKTGYVGVN
jgi:phosphate transport system substrate-binding protein